MSYANWHGIELVLALAVVGLQTAKIWLSRRFWTSAWSAPLCLGAAVLCALGSFAAVMGYRPAWQVWGWVAAGVVWLVQMGTVRRRQRREAARAREGAQRWEQWKQAQRDNGWAP